MTACCCYVNYATFDSDSTKVSSVAAAKIIGEEELPGNNLDLGQSSVDVASQGQTVTDEREKWAETVEERGGRSDSEEEVTRVVATKYEEFQRTCGDLLDPGKARAV